VVLADNNEGMERFKPTRNSYVTALARSVSGDYKVRFESDYAVACVLCSPTFVSPRRF